MVVGVVLAMSCLSAQAKKWTERSGNTSYFYYECDVVVDGIAYELDDENLQATVTFFSRKITSEYQSRH
ncbi:MAG: hypothetical protein J6X70_01205, partial [Muribaculaceae bacterium]|nr:hypothetical protein [Muribaculaceae bacterium]